MSKDTNNHIALREWLCKKRSQAMLLRLYAMRALGEHQLLDSWDKSELDLDPDTGEPERALLQRCDDHVTGSGESTVFLFMWCDANGGAVAQRQYKLSPALTDDGKPLPRNAADAGISQNQIIAQFLRHDEIRERVLIQSLGPVMDAQAVLVKQLSDQLKQAYAYIEALHVQLIAARQQAGSEESEEERAERLQTEQLKRRGLERLLAVGEELAPDAGRALLDVFAKRVGGSGQRPNGHSEG